MIVIKIQISIKKNENFFKKNLILGMKLWLGKEVIKKMVGLGVKNNKKMDKELVFQQQISLKWESDVMQPQIPIPATFFSIILTCPHLGGVIFPSKTLRPLSQLQNSKNYPQNKSFSLSDFHMVKVMSCYHKYPHQHIFRCIHVSFKRVCPSIHLSLVPQKLRENSIESLEKWE